MDKRAGIQDWINPVPQPSATVNPGKEMTDADLQNVAKLGLGWFGIAAAVRVAKHYADIKREAKMDKDLGEYINARYPILSPDAGTIEDKKKALKERTDVEYGIPENMKVAGESADDPAPPQKTNVFVSSMQGIADKNQPSLLFAYRIAAMMGAGYAGYKLTDKLLQKYNQRRLERGITHSRNKMDELLRSEYMRTRGLAEPEPELPKLPEAAEEAKALPPAYKSPITDDLEQRQEKVAEDEADITGDPGSTGFMHGAWNAVKQVYPAYAGIAAVLTYMAMKEKMDAADPNRKSFAQLEDYARERAYIKDAPMLIDASSMPEFRGAVKKGKKAIPKYTAMTSGSNNPYAGAGITL